MTINTKFNPSDYVYFTHNSKVVKGKIWEIFISVITNDSLYDIKYTIINDQKEYYKNIQFDRLFPESWLFSTKEELLKSL